MISRFLELTHRWFKRAAFAWSFLLLMLGLGIWLVSLPFVQELTSQLESVFLDMRLRARAKTLVPSSDIVILAFGQNTANYTRNHPEYGIPSNTMPRDRLAEIVDFLSNEGARAIILDVELANPTTPKADQALADAIQRAGNVYAAARMDRTLDSYIHQWKPEYLYQGFLEMHHQPNSIVRFARKMNLELNLFHQPGMPFFDLATLGNTNLEPLFPAYSLLPGFYLKNAFEGISPMTLFTRAIQPPLTSVESVRGFVEHNCLVESYQQLYRNMPEQLTLLNRQAIPVQWGSFLPEQRIEDRFSFCITSPTVPAIFENLKGIGITKVEYDQKSFVRDIPAMYQGYDHQFYTYLGMRPAMDLLGVHSLTYYPEALQFGGKRVPLIDGWRIVLNWRSPEALMHQSAGTNQNISGEDGLDGYRALGYGHLYRMVEAMSVLRWIHGWDLNSAIEPPNTLYNVVGEPKSGRYSFKNKIVIYGDTLRDIHPTPMGNLTYGPEVLATALDMLMNDQDFVHQLPFWQSVIGCLLFAGLVVLAVVGVSQFSIGFGLGVLTLGLFWLVNFILFIRDGLWVPLAIPTILFVVCLIMATLYKYAVQDREKRQLTGIFSNLVSPQIFNQIIINPDQAMSNLTGRKKYMTVLFADIKNFTTTFENDDAEQIVAQLNDYFETMVNIVLKHGGTIDKFMGDGLMAFFGAPQELPDHAERACRTALEMMAALSELNQKWEEHGQKTLDHGIGISTGMMNVGLFGSRKIQSITVMGGVVNLGARLEAYSRKTDASIIISEPTCQDVGDKATVRPLGNITVKGFSEPVPVYSLEAMVPESQAQSA